MGANTSLLSPDRSNMLDNTSNVNTNLGDMPESCVALILSYLEPVDICRLARINRAFRAASTADFIWASKLPSNYRNLAGSLLVTKKLGEKEIFARLSRGVSFDSGNKDFWLDKTTGGVCVSISSKALTITGIDDRRYWNHIPSNESRYRTVAYLKQIWWVEVHGDVEFLFPPGTYSLKFKLRLGKVVKQNGRRVFSNEDVHGWDVKPVELKFMTSTGQRSVTKRFLKKTEMWEYHNVGEFVVEDSNTPTKVKFSLTQIDCTHTKGGLAIDSILICPSDQHNM